jgi:integrase
MPLTDKQVQNVRAVSDRTQKISDGGGLQLWVTPTGGKLWNFAYRFCGKQRKLAIGPYPAVGLGDARGRRDEAKRQLSVGLDPSQQKQLAKLAKATEQANTFESIATEFIANKRDEARADSTLAKLDWLVRLATPVLGSRPITEIAAPEVLKVLKSVEARNRRETAKRLRAVVGAIFRYAMATGRATTDPTTALRRALKAPIVRHRAAIIESIGFGHLLRAIEDYSGSPEVRMGLQLLALTFVRPGELRGGTWAEIDLDAAIWSIPAGRMKMGRPHRIPLARQTIEILKGIRGIISEGPYVLTSAWARGRPLSENTLNVALRRMGFSKDEMTSHGFRATASSMLNESGLWNPDAIEAQLAHVEGNAVRRAYARAEFWEERVRMMQWWADRLDELRSSGEVISLSQEPPRPSATIK